MDWYVIDKNYIKYLTQFDSRVGYVEYGNRLKLHVGILLTINEFIIMSPFLLQNPNIKKCPIIWIFTSCKTKLPDIFMLY